MAVTVDKLEKLYDLVLDDRELTTSLLNDIGFNQDDLQELLEKEIIKTIGKGIYALIGVNGLYRYGKGLLFERRISEAIEVFYKCHEIDPIHISTCFKLFYSKIKKGEYYESLEYFEVFFNNGDSFHKTDGNLFLYLLNLIINIPEKYKEHLSTLNFEDLKTKADDMRVKNMEFENTVRRYIFENKFYEALEALVNSANFNKFMPVQRAIVVNLLKQIIKNKEQLAKAVVAEEISQKAEEKKKIHWLKSFMASQNKYLIKSGISFLPKEDSEKVICLADLMAKYYPQIELIIINDRDNCHCVLRNVDISKDMVVVKDLMDLADQYFILGNFSEAKKNIQGYCILRQ